MCPSVYYNGVDNNCAQCNKKRCVTRLAAAGFVRDPPITCPLPPYGKLGIFVPLQI